MRRHFFGINHEVVNAFGATRDLGLTALAFVLIDHDVVFRATALRNRICLLGGNV